MVQNFWCRLLAKAVRANDIHAGAIWISEDISDRKIAEAERERLLLEQQALLDNALVGIAFIRCGCIVRCNRRMETLLGEDIRSIFAS